MKGYKAFEKGMICRGKQYAENTVFEEESAEICKSGMHFVSEDCPLEVLNYYDLVDKNGNEAEFAEVEALDEPITDDNKKFCSKKLKIGGKVSFADLVKAEIEICAEKAESKSADDESRLAASGDESCLAASGDESCLAASGDGSRLAASGNESRLAASGYRSCLAASGDESCLAASGDGSRLAASGDESCLAASGDGSRLAASGDGSRLAASGNRSCLVATGKNSVICCSGHNCIAKAKKGSWITLAEWDYSGDEPVPICVKTEQVDGERIKEDVSYVLKNGEFQEVPEE
jgi:hypothetical protein